MAKKGRPFTYQSDEDKPETLSARLPRALTELVKRYAAAHGKIPISELIREGLEWRIGDGDPRGMGMYLDQPTGIREQIYDSNTAIAPAPQKDKALQEVRDLLARQWEQIQALAQAIERQTTPAGNGVSDSNTPMPATDVAISYQEASYTEVVTLTDEPRPESTIPATVPPAGKAGADTETSSEGNTVIQPAEGKPRGRRPVLRPGILALLDKHPEGLTAAELKVYLRTEKHIGDTLAGMARDGLLVKQGKGQGLRYQRATS